MSAEWIRSNMLHTDDKCNRKLTETELKVQRSLQRLSVPDWYLNKHTNPPKILNTKPFELRSSPWKNSSARRDCTLNSPSSSLSDVEKNLNGKVQKMASPATKSPIKKDTLCHQQKLPATRRKRHASKEEIFDIDIPIAKSRKRISKTLPKMSPSRKIPNINLVLPPGPRINFSKESIYLDDIGDKLFTRRSKSLQRQMKSLELNDVTKRSAQSEKFDIIYPNDSGNNLFTRRLKNLQRQIDNLKQNNVTERSAENKEFESICLDNSGDNLFARRLKNLRRQIENWKQNNVTERSAENEEFESVYLDDSGDNLFARRLKNLRRQIENWKQNDVTERSAENEQFESVYLDDSDDNLFARRLKNSQRNDNDVFEVPEVPATSVKSTEFNIRATSTPKSFRASTVTGNAKMMRALCNPATKESSTFEHDSMTRAMNLSNTAKNVPKSRNLSPSILEKTSIFESNSSLNSFDRSYTKTSPDRLLLERNIRSIDSVRAKASIFEDNSTTDNFNRSCVKYSSNKEKLSTRDIREKAFIFESNSSIDSSDRNNAVTWSSILLSRKSIIRPIESARARATIFESSSSMSFDQSYIKPSSDKGESSSSTKNIQSIGSAREDSPTANFNFDQSYAGTSLESSNFQSDDSLAPREHPALITHELAKQPEDPRVPRKEAVRSEAKSTATFESSAEGKILNVDEKLPNVSHSSRREKKRNRDGQWSYDKFLCSTKRSVESPTTSSTSKQPNRKVSAIQEIIRTFNEKVKISEGSRRSGNSSERDRNFVRQLVNALERGDISAIKKMTHRTDEEDEEDSSSEPEAKSHVTSSTFLEDTDSSSSYDRGSPTENCDEQRYDTETATENLTVEIEEQEEDDSVYWIPIPKRKIPRTSSLLSVISKLSSNGYSPCISPIRCEDEMIEYSQQATNPAQNAAKKLFRINETVVIDSGYSDKSENRSNLVNSVPSVADSILWRHDDASYNFQPERKSPRRKWSPKPISIAGRVYCTRY